MKDESQSTNSPDEAGLVARARAGDVTAAAELFAGYYTEVRGVVRSVLWRHCPDEIDDCTQEVFVKVLNKPYVERGCFRAWLRRVARNHALDTLRRCRRRLEKVPGPGDEPAAHENPLDRLLLLECLETLRQSVRDAFVARYVDEQSVEEIAQLIGWTKSTTEVRISEAKKKIKACLQARGSLKG